jgi:Xaa-Pro aminopeptidase
VLPAGTYKQRSNDTDYPFRAHSAFAHLTGWASDSVPDSVLVFDPREGGDGHDVTLYLRERADRTTAEFYSDATIGEFWIGPRPALAGVAGELGLTTAPIEDFAATDGDLVLDEDPELTRVVSELRLVKDDYEIAQLRLAVEVTARGFDDIVADLPRIIETPARRACGRGHLPPSRPHRGQRRGVRHDRGIRSARLLPALDAQRRRRPSGDLILIDAGAEVDSLYTADITRTIPVSGTFSPSSA